jgi:segregation and condensation protein B
MEVNRIKQIVEAALMASAEPLSVDRLVRLFRRGEVPQDELKAAVRQGIEELQADCEGRGFELVQVASGFRYQVRQELSEWISRLWEEKPVKYSRAFLETLALVAYKQPVTRGDIELVRGVAVSPNIIRTLMERGWIRVVGARDVPGRPALYGTTKEFLDYFNLQNLEQLPPLAEIRSLLEQDDPDDPIAHPAVTFGSREDFNADGVVVEGGVSVEMGVESGAEFGAEADVVTGVEMEVGEPDQSPAPARSAHAEEQQAPGLDTTPDDEAESASASNVIHLPTAHG